MVHAATSPPHPVTGVHLPATLGTLSAKPTVRKKETDRWRLAADHRGMPLSTWTPLQWHLMWNVRTAKKYNQHLSFFVQRNVIVYLLWQEALDGVSRVTSAAVIDPAAPPHSCFTCKMSLRGVFLNFFMSVPRWLLFHIYPWYSLVKGYSPLIPYLLYLIFNWWLFTVSSFVEYYNWTL